MKKIKGVLITPNKQGTTPRVYEMEVNSFENYYPLLECEVFDIQERNFNGTWLDIYCDDEGLFKADNQCAIVTVNSNGTIIERIVGNVFIVGHDNEGKTISLTNQEIEKVLSTVHNLITLSNTHKVCVVTC